MEFTATANGNSTIGYATYNSSAWRVGSTNGAMQGIYDPDRKFNESDRRVGVMVFEGANNALKYSRISKIELKFTFSNAGYSNREKTLYLRKSAYQFLNTSEVANTHIGERLGEVRGMFSNNTVTVTVSESENSELFANLKQYLRTGNNALVIFDESTDHASAGADYTYNYLRITSCTMTVTYEEGGTVRYDTGSEWKVCMAYYDDGTAFIPCNVFYDTGTEFKPVGG